MFKPFYIAIFSIFLISSCSTENTVAVESNTSNIQITKDTPSSYSRRGYKAEPDDIVLGNMDAKVIFVEYFSPTCPHCVYYHKKIFPEIKKLFIDTRKIQYIAREFIGNKQDLDATLLARCSNNTIDYFKFMEIILSQQDSWAFSRNYREKLTNIGMLGGVSAAQYTKCLADETKIKHLIDNTRLIANEPFFIGTPTFLINGNQIKQLYSIEALSRAINTAILENDK